MLPGNLNPDFTVKLKKKGFPLLLILALLLQCACNSTEKRMDGVHNPGQLVPMPHSVKYLDGVFTMDTSTVLLIDDGDHAGNLDFSAGVLIRAIGTLLPDPPDVRQSEDQAGAGNAIILRLDGSIENNEGYRISIGPEQIMLAAKAPAGIFYAAQTLIQLLPMVPSREPGGITLPCMDIEDHPGFAWRGMHLDVSRHFFPADSVRRFIDFLAMHKMNIFHWHLTDDQGWRIEIKRHPELTGTGAWREDTRDREWSYDQFPVREGRPVYGGYYTQEEIREIVTYATERHITIVPEIDVPGHSWAALLAYPHLSCSGVPYYHSQSDPFSFTDPFCAGNPGTYQLLEDVFSEVIDLFPSQYIHLGGDEAKKSPWETCGKCRKIMDANGLADTGELQRYFIDRIGAFITSKGRRYIGWDEILEGGLPEHAAVMSWRGEEGGIEAARRGNPVVMVPSHTLYFNRSQFDAALEGRPGGLVTSLKDVYRYNPVPGELAGKERALVLGVQGCLWTEHIQTWQDVQMMLFPRLLALAEIAWNPTENRDFDTFSVRVMNHCQRLDAAGIRYFIPAPTGLEEHNAFPSGEPAVIHLENPLPGGRIVYTTDGREPGNNSTEYDSRLVIHDRCVVKSALVLPGGKTGLVRSSHIEFLDPLSPVSVASASLSPGLRYTYMEGSVITLDDLDRMERVRLGVTDSLQLVPERAEDGFGLEFKGYLRIDSPDIYTFHTTSDDGSRLYIGELLVVDNDGIHAPRRMKGQVALSPGYHPVTIQFFDGNYGEELSVTLSGQKCGPVDLNHRLFH